VATVDHLLSRVPFFDAADADAPNASFSVRGKAEIRNSFDNARLAVFARSISFALIEYSADHNICFFFDRLRNAYVARGLRMSLCYNYRRNDRISLCSSIPS
jgi:hypothetical protein